MEVSGYFSLLVEEDLVSELTKETISKEGALTDLRKKMISLSSYVIDKLKVGVVKKPVWICGWN